MQSISSQAALRGRRRQRRNMGQNAHPRNPGLAIGWFVGYGFRGRALELGQSSPLPQEGGHGVRKPSSPTSEGHTQEEAAGAKTPARGGRCNRDSGRERAPCGGGASSLLLRARQAVRVGRRNGDPYPQDRRGQVCHRRLPGRRLLPRRQGCPVPRNRRNGNENVPRDGGGKRAAGVYRSSIRAKAAARRGRLRAISDWRLTPTTRQWSRCSPTSPATPVTPNSNSAVKGSRVTSPGRSSLQPRSAGGSTACTDGSAPAVLILSRLRRRMTLSQNRMTMRTATSTRPMIPP